ncbi:MAG: hypothetical protein Q4G58_16240 [bacterium]|nr:hypothetical protein [bacterium]
MKIVETVNQIMSSVAALIGQIPSILWWAVGFGILLWIAYIVYRIIHLIHKVKNFKAEALLEDMENALQSKIDLVERVIAPADKEQKHKKWRK